MSENQFRTTLYVQAWQYEGNGVLPKGSELAMKSVDWHVVDREPSSGDQFMYTEVFKEPVPDHIHYLSWFDCGGRQKCDIGDWIVSHEYGVEAVADAWFRKEYHELG